MTPGFVRIPAPRADYTPPVPARNQWAEFHELLPPGDPAWVAAMENLPEVDPKPTGGK